jgi:transcription termination/antitermination protein NusA
MGNMATDEILEALRQISREKSVDRKLLIETLEAGLLSAAKKRYATAVDVQVAFDDMTGRIKVMVHKKVVPVAIDLEGEIDLDEAQQVQPGVRVGSTVAVEVPVAEFGRNAIQAAKQVLVQKVREAERENVYQEYIDRKGQILSGSVSQVDRGSVIVKIIKTEGIIGPRDLIFRDRFKIGDPVRALLVEVDRAQKGPMLLLSRTHPDFVRRLFENEVPEIFERVVEIKDIAREPGSRTKITVVSHDDRVDPVGACVGMKGSRVQSIVRELGGERIDIVPWSSDPKILVSRALSPARVLDVILNEAEKRVVVVVADDQLSLAIGKSGQNARLAHRLTGYGIDLKSQSQIEVEDSGDAGAFPDIELEELSKELGPRMVEKLIKAGKETLRDVLRTSVEELMEIPGIGEKTAGRLMGLARQILEEKAAGVSSAPLEEAEMEEPEDVQETVALTEPTLEDEHPVAEGDGGTEVAERADALSSSEDDLPEPTAEKEREADA